MTPPTKQMTPAERRARPNKNWRWPAHWTVGTYRWFKDPAQLRRAVVLAWYSGQIHQ